MKDKIRIAIIDDQKLIREGIKAMFLGQPRLQVVLATDNANQLLSEIENDSIDIILLDISMPGKSGLELLKEIKTANDSVKIIMLSAMCDPEHIEKAIQAGANGFISKETHKDELLRAITKVHGGKRYIGEELIDTVYSGYSKSLAQLEQLEGHTLSQREEQLVKYIAEGYLQKQIAHEMGISIKTVESHKTNIMKKLGLDNTAALIKYAIKAGITEL